MTLGDVGRFRYRYDDPTIYGFPAPSGETGGASALPGALAQHVRISDGVLPQIDEILDAASEDLRLDVPFTGFVYASPETNASCAREPDGSVLVFISSALVELLSPDELRFVVGHEFAHAHFGHHGYPAASAGEPDERKLELSRAAEISADRLGLACCRSSEHAIRAIIKTAAGLGDAHLKLDLVEYLRQGASLMAEPDSSLAWSTHPPLILRARAALRFDSILHGARAGDDFEHRLRDLDDEIFDELDIAAHGAEGSRTARDAAFWTIASRLCADGALDEPEQQRMVNVFGVDRVDALRRMLRSESMSGALELIDKRVHATQGDLEEASLASRRRYETLLANFKEERP
jgi:hypothetical protein